MKSFKLMDGDRVIENGSWVYVSDSETVKQRVINSLRLDLGAWYFNPKIGINWFAIYSLKAVTERLIRLNIQRVLKNDPEVTKIQSLTISFNRSERKIHSVFVIDTIYGPVEGEI